MATIWQTIWNGRQQFGRQKPIRLTKKKAKTGKATICSSYIDLWYYQFLCIDCNLDGNNLAANALANNNTTHNFRPCYYYNSRYGNFFNNDIVHSAIAWPSFLVLVICFDKTFWAHTWPWKVLITRFLLFKKFVPEGRADIPWRNVVKIYRVLEVKRRVESLALRYRADFFTKNHK